MNSTVDLKHDEKIEWDLYKGKTPDGAIAQLYDDAQKLSGSKRTWYWNSIKNKRWTSLWARGIAFLLLTAGTTLPLLASLSDDAPTRLTCTQIAITFLAAAGLIQIADKAFGWSTGWMRYIATVTAMESEHTAFDIAWSQHLFSTTGSLSVADVQALFALAKQFECGLIKLQTDETNGWITEFNAGISLLDATIKAHREDTQKQLETLRVTAAKAQLDAKAEEKARTDAVIAATASNEPGVIDVALKFKAHTVRVAITLNGATVVQDFFGTAWTTPKLAPGVHTILVRTLGETIIETSASVVVEPGKVAKLGIELPA